MPFQKICRLLQFIRRPAQEICAGQNERQLRKFARLKLEKPQVNPAPRAPAASSRCAESAPRPGRGSSPNTPRTTTAPACDNPPRTSPPPRRCPAHTRRPAGTTSGHTTAASVSTGFTIVALNTNAVPMSISPTRAAICSRSNDSLGVVPVENMFNSPPPGFFRRRIFLFPKSSRRCHAQSARTSAPPEPSSGRPSAP